MNRLDMTELMFYVEPMQQSDVATVATIERRVFTMPWSSNAYSYELRANPLSHYFVARARALKRGLDARGLDPSVIGYGGFWLMLDEAHVCTLGVHPDWRQRGVGELLLSTMIGEAARLNAHVVTLEVRVSNQAAQNLYQKYGFAAVGLRRGYYSDNQEDALIMTTEPIHTPAYESRYNRLQRMLRARLQAQQPERA
ncbi:MAG TPA: ribosomal protein S18-alanine N-acetyltransferase [Anaerolineae bacterium]|nr:ribosomal protein S18-alanine N-acetyltransferase [Anaerolineae bacterium]HOQ98490.1 ribosomal protein S18-alanine N-acetyltransferase [Anaerolineae bacterium]HPL28112.1 ribosomal protein S18-alanine N-acetyltransferase [Anaerolineae bacterium]